MRANIYFALAVTFAALLLLLSPMWTYFVNLVLGLPCLALSWMFWRLATRKQPPAWRNRIVPLVWLASAGVALLSLVGFLIFN
jgi:hypothetical protein